MTIKRQYKDQESAYRAIENDSFNYRRCRRISDIVRKNISRITHINGLPVSSCKLITENDLEFLYTGSTMLTYGVIIYLDITFR